MIRDGRENSLWFDNWHPRSPLADSNGEKFINDSGMRKGAMVNLLAGNTDWVWSVTFLSGWYPFIEFKLTKNK